jgi:hypothetical protein
MWIIDDSEAKTKEDYINLLNEINAYRELDGQDFDFGTGLIVNEMSFGSEDAYYEMDIWSIESHIEYWDYSSTKNKPKKKRENKYARNRKYKDKLWKMVDKDWFPVWMNGKWFEEGNYPKRYYRGKRSSYLKKQSNKKIRQYKGEFEPKGNKFHRVFDFWWELD